MKSRIRANEKAAQKPKPQAPAKSPPRFAVGQFVLPDTPERHAVVIVDVFSTEPQKRSPPDYFYLCKGSAARDVGDTYLLGAPEAPLGCSWIAEAKLRAYEVVPSAFPLLDMPMPALAHVLWFVPLHEGAQLAGLCRKLRSAFQDAVEWRRRCATELPGVDIDAQFNAQRCTSWIDFYRSNVLYNVRIVTVFVHRGGCSLSGDFKIGVRPSATVASFLAAVAAHPKNRQQSAHLAPHNPARIGRHDDDYNLVPDAPDAKPNNSFDPSDGSRTVKEAGLFDGAVLEQPEEMRRD